MAVEGKSQFQNIESDIVLNWPSHDASMVTQCISGQSTNRKRQLTVHPRITRVT